MKIDLTRAIKYKDADLNTLELDLDSLTGRDLIDTEETLKKLGLTVAAWEYSRTFLLYVAAKSAHSPAEILKDLSAVDFTNVVNEVLAFLGGTASSDKTDTPSGKS